MKSLLVLFCLATVAFGQEEAVCNCGAFVSTVEGELEVHRFPSVQLEDCSQEAICSARCKAEWENLTNDGDLCTVRPDGDTVAQHMCTVLADLGHENLQPHPVYLYYNVCHGPWQYDNQIARQDLVCRDSTAVVDC